MADVKRCDLCGMIVDKTMTIEFPYEKIWMLFFKKSAFNHYADVCFTCLGEIRRLRQEQIKASEVSFEIREED